MFKTIAIASIAAAAAFAIAVGCSSPDTGGYVKNNGSSRGDDDDTTSGKTSSSGGSTSGAAVAADCTKLPAADKNAACDTCARGKCCAEYAACQNSTACQQQKKCVEACADGDLVCLLGCQSSNDKASELAGEFASCLNEKCSSECAGSQPNLDAGGTDPFGDI